MTLPLPTRPAGVLFDMDGVLTANNLFHRQAWQEVAAEVLGLQLTEHDLDTKVDGGRNPEIIERLTGRYPSEALAARFHEVKEGRYRDLARGALREVEGLSAYLTALEERGIPFALVTSADRVNVEFGMEALGLGHRFGPRILGEDVTRGKPHPEPFERGAALLGLNPHTCLAHEDAVNGVRSAAGAGCTVVALTTTATAPALLAAGAVQAVPDFTDWTSWLT
ncbi:HAD family hydrolase [Deinococcus hopiensis]|uniref:Haloacid dehalogenase superfamily, subfamily IA, variant 3 with third motif having DD or ED n=1 Tax=Deinococcus hopiensis KR-140 TaxID=695939 RepID=A0A1W1VPY4_9DEIO|nr:HAD family phosphatase [Deinococcus hopiensis]SMB95417.1 haloacid dehalogenase superfamily, subfamily IA, variant 3 with third motif having DD or ED [Deinococcus hopiensis KR-140]